MSDDLLEPVEGEEINVDEVNEKDLLDNTPPQSVDVKEDVIEEGYEVKNENFEDDLFDAAIEPSGPSNSEEKTNGNEIEMKAEAPEVANNANSSTNAKGSSLRRYCCYVSQMTWWTTDVDLENMIKSCEVDDIVDIKFYENRLNGQSKGFALVVLGSDASVKKIMEELPNKPIHGQHVAVLPYSKQNLEKLDGAARKNDPRIRAAQSESGSSNSASAISMGTVRIDGTSSTGLSTSSGAGGIPGLVIRPNALAQASVFPSNQFSQPPPAIRPMINQSSQQQSNFMSRAPPQNLSVPPPSIRAPNSGMAGFGNIMNQNAMMSGPPGIIMPMQNGYPSMNQAYGMPNYNGPPPSLLSGMEQPVSDQEFEEIMHRNHAVCSSAISRAVSDAATGEYRSAIETLVTAVNLIKQSKISHHDRCKALIASLEDTVRGIENKHYSRRHRRSRSRSPDRRKHRRRSRSRSRDRSPRRRY